MAELLENPFSRAIACRNNRVAWVVRFMNYGEKIDVGDVECLDDKVGGSRG